MQVQLAICAFALVVITGCASFLTKQQPKIDERALAESRYTHAHQQRMSVIYGTEFLRKFGDPAGDFAPESQRESLIEKLREEPVNALRAHKVELIREQNEVNSLMELRERFAQQLFASEEVKNVAQH